jgi:glycosyltransferase involved in cell wall biosynthesis
MGESGARVLVVPPGAGSRFLLRAVRPRRVRLIHFDSLREAARLSRRARGLGATLVASTEAPELYDASPDEDWLGRLWDELDGLVVPDAELMARARRLGSPRRLAVAAIPPSPDPAPPAGDRHAAATGEIRACSIGGLHWTSAFEFAMQAIALLRDRGIRAHLTLIGSGDLLDELMYSRRELSLESALEFIPGPGTPQALRALRSASVYVHSSTVPGVTPGLIAAGLWELPVLATDGGVLVRAIAGGDEAAVPIPRRDARALAAAMERLAADPELACRLGASARSRATELTDARGREVALGDLYERALESARSRKRDPNV